MAITTVLFDLDGTLLPMDQEDFLKSYFLQLTSHMAGHGYEPDQLVQAVWAGTAAMVQNTGEQTNEAVFWDTIAGIWGERVPQDLPLFEDFYKTGFGRVRESCGFDPRAAETVALCRHLGFRVILATNPVFPALATRQRIAWAGLAPEEFELVTAYENSCRCKPNPDYYRDILRRQGLRPEECVMVGNDVEEDMVAGTLGIRTFLLTHCLINRCAKDISVWPHGDFCALQTFLRGLNKEEPCSGA